MKLPIKRYSILFIFLIALSIISNMAYKFYASQAKEFILKTIAKESQSNPYASVFTDKVEFKFFPPRVILKDVKIIPKKKLKKRILKSFVVSQIIIEIGLSKKFKPKVSHIKFKKADISASLLSLENPGLSNQVITKNQKKQTSESEEQQINATRKFTPLIKGIVNFNFLKQIPVDEFIFEQIKIINYLPIKNTFLRTDELFLSLSKDKNNGIYIHFLSSSIELKTTRSAITASYKSPLIQKIQSFLTPIFKEQDSIDLNIQAKIYANKDEIKFLPIKIQKEESFVTVLGSLKGQWLHKKIQSLELDLSSFLNLQESTGLFQKFFSKKLPQLSGQAEFKINFRKEFSKKPKINFLIQTRKFFINQFEIGKWRTRGSYINNQALFSEFSITNSAGSAHLKKIKLNKQADKKYTFSAENDIKNLELGQLLSSLGISEVPIFLKIRGTAPCSGSLYPELQIKCKPKFESDKLIIWPNIENKDSQILNISKLSASGTVIINSKQVTYSSTARMGSSFGSSNGYIKYKKELKISYEGQTNDLKNLNYLFGLNLKGKAKVTGEIKGNPSGITVTSDIEGANISVNNWKIGNSQVSLKYKDGLLTQDFKGIWNKTKYQGSFILNLLDSQMYLTTSFPDIILSDIMSMANIQLPIKAKGIGSLQFKAWGNIQKPKTHTYKLTALIKNGSIANEPFDKLNLDIQSKKGWFQTNKAQFTRGTSELNIDAHLSPKKEIKALLTGSKIHLSESNLLKNLGFNLTHYLDIQVNIKGSIKNPQGELKGKFYGPEGLSSGPPVNINVKLQNKIAKGSLEYEDKLMSQFQYTIKGSTDSWIKLKTKKLDLAKLASIFSQNALPYDLKSNGSIEADIRIPQSNWLKTQGFITANELTIQRGLVKMKNPKPIRISFGKGEIRIKNTRIESETRIEGKPYFIDIKTKKSKLDRLNIRAKGKIQLSLISAAFPFLEDFSGEASFNSQIKGSLKKPRILGTSYAKNVFIKFPDFKAPIENLKADIAFNQNKISINSLRASFSKGLLTGSGIVPINRNKSKKASIDLELKWSKGQLHFPEGVKTGGTANIKITGKNQPYLLKGSYLIDSGEIKKNLAKLQSPKKIILTSSYLPKFTSDTNASPLNLDFKLNLIKPIAIDLSLAQANLKTNIQGDIRVTGTLAKPLVKGIIEAKDDSKAIFQDNIFDITTGILKYNNKPLSQPEIYIRAETQVEDYDISLIIQGLFNKLKLKFNSQPKLPEKDIISLLVLGYTPKYFDKNSDLERQMEQSGFQLGSIFLQEQLGLNDTIKKRLGFSVSLSSSYDKEENTSVTSIVINKKWKPKFTKWKPSLDISAKRTLEKEASNEIKVKYKVNKRLSAIGIFENQKDDLNTINDADRNNAFGLDLEYKIEFK